MKLKINDLIDVNSLIKDLNLSQTRTTNLKCKIYYLLSQITETNDNYKLNESNNGYHNICSDKMKRILGNKDFYFIRKLLMNNIDPIIEVNGSWYNAVEINKSGFCQGYRITEKYNTGEIKYKSIPKKMASKIQKHNPDNILDEGQNSKYEFLFDQFKQHNLSFDPLLINYIHNFGSLLLEKADNNEFQIKLINNLIGRWLYFINQIEKGAIWYNVSSKNYRLNSSITNLSKLIRPFLMCNGELLTCVDVSSSQPYILSSVMQKRFYYDTGTGYNLKTIYPELYTELVDKGHIDTSISYSNNDYIQYYTSHTGTTSNPYYYTSGTSSFMWCEFLSEKELESIISYTQSPFNLDFYSYIIKKHNPELEINSTMRDKLKGTMMFVLFDDNSNHRNNNEQIKIFESVFPGVDNWIRKNHTMIGKDRFSYLLQRTESYLIIDVICREFNQLYPNAPLLTIHDGIFTTEMYSKLLNEFVIKRLKEITGISSGCKIKRGHSTSQPLKKDIESKWTKIQPITNKKKFDKKRAGVFDSNVVRGSGFLEKSH